MSKIDQPKIPLEILNESEFNWELTRHEDGLVKRSNKIVWIEWNEDRTAKAIHDNPEVGRSLLMGPLNRYFTWQTTVITEILENSESVVKFKTLNSTYTLRNLNHE